MIRKEKSNMGFCFVRTEKIKTAADFVRKYEHNYRIKNVPNAIKELSDQNEELVRLTDHSGNACDYYTAYKDRIKQLDYYKKNKVHKNNILGLEIFVSFTREDAAHINIDEWKRANVKWMREYFNKSPEKYGDNLISVMCHGDECGNVHCHAIVIPIDEQGKLSAEKYIGGRAMMRNMQDSYAKAMKPFGLERGLKGSSARHQDITKFYAKLNEKMDVPKPEKGESAEEYHTRILELIQTERAGSLRKILEMDQELRHKHDVYCQQMIEDAKKQAQRRIDIADEKLQKKENLIRQREEEIRKKGKKIAELNQEIDEIRDTVERYRKTLGSFKVLRKEIDEYRYQKEALEYLDKNGDYSILVADTYRNLEAVYSLYEMEKGKDFER